MDSKRAEDSGPILPAVPDRRGVPVTRKRGTARLRIPKWVMVVASVLLNIGFCGLRLWCG